LKNVAKGAFSRHSVAPEPLPTASFAALGNHKGPWLKKVAKASELSSYNGDREEDGNNRTPVASKPRNDTQETWATSSYSNSTNSPADLSSYNHTNTPERKSATIFPTKRDSRAIQKPSLGSNNDSSGALPDEATDATTSTDCASQSQARLGPLTHKTHTEESSTNTDANNAENRCSRPSSSRAFSFNESINGQEDWNRIAMPIEFNDHQDNLQRTPTKKPAPKVSLLRSLKSKKPKNVLGPSTNDEADGGNSQRKSSKTKSASPDFGFLPQLKHQPLPRPKKQRDKQATAKEPKSNHLNAEDKTTKASVRFPPPSSRSRSSSSSHLPPLAPGAGNSPYLNSSSSSTLHSPRNIRFPALHSPLTPLSDINPLAKMFVICCSCRYFHDMPSKVYECMTKPDDLVEDKELGVRGVVSMAVKCPWCGHGMSTVCCEGYVGLVYLRERLH
jgi:hypothetical protein